MLGGMNPSIGIVTLNAKFIHSSLSLRYLRNAARRAGFENVWIQEFIINQPVWKIAGCLCYFLSHIFQGSGPPRGVYRFFVL